MYFIVVVLIDNNYDTKKPPCREVMIDSLRVHTNHTSLAGRIIIILLIICVENVNIIVVVCAVILSNLVVLSRFESRGLAVTSDVTSLGKLK